MTTTVWVKLHIGENDENPFILKIKSNLDDIFDLKEKIKEKNSNVLRAIDADRLNVYAAGTCYPIKEGAEILAANVKVQADIAYENPLIVVAPATLWVSFFVSHLLHNIETVCDSSQQSLHTGSNCQSLDSAAATAAVLDGSPVG